MKATGEVMSIGRTMEESLLKAVRSLEIGVDHIYLKKFETINTNDLLEYIKKATDERLYAIAELFRRKIDLIKNLVFSVLDKHKTEAVTIPQDLDFAIKNYLFKLDGSETSFQDVEKIITKIINNYNDTQVLDNTSLSNLIKEGFARAISAYANNNPGSEFDNLKNEITNNYSDLLDLNTINNFLEKQITTETMGIWRLRATSLH